MRIYIVFGSDEEGFEENHWPIVAYTNEELAKEHMLKATIKADEIVILQNEVHKRACEDGGGLTDEEIKEANRLAKSNPYDTEEQGWLERRSYFCRVIELIDKIFDKDSV